MEIREKIESIVNEWINDGECFLVEVKVSPARVAVYIDKPTGISLKECAALSKTLTGALEAEGVWENRELEVSSPGLEQPMRVPQQYLRRIGSELKVITAQGREHRGILKAADSHGFDLHESTSRKENKKRIETETLHHFQYDQIKEAKLIISIKIR